MNQSIQAGQCAKSIDWIKTVDSHLESGKTFQDVLFIMVAPGPFLPDINPHEVTVVVEEGHLSSGLLKSRTQFFLSESMTVKVYVDLSDKIHEMDIDCLNDGQNLSEKVDQASCFRNNTTEVDSTNQTAIQTQQNRSG